MPCSPAVKCLSIKTFKYKIVDMNLAYLLSSLAILFTTQSR